MEVTKPYEFIGFGAMDVTKPYEFIGFWAMHVTKTYEFVGLGDKSPGFPPPRLASTGAKLVVAAWGVEAGLAGPVRILGRF